VRIPEKVKIGPYVYRITQHKVVLSDENHRLAGQCDYEQQIIRIGKNMARETTEVTFFHESFHAMNDVYQLGLKERQIAVLAPAVLSLLRENDLLKEGDEA
jgi:FKBP-type peptidyl-prolyl cis-trans isomerase 2